MDHRIEKLQNGEEVVAGEGGNSMVPIISSRQKVTYSPIEEHSELKKGDIVLAKVKGNLYTHLIKGVKGKDKKLQFLIGNNHGGINGWTSYKNVYGKVTEIHGK